MLLTVGSVAQAQASTRPSFSHKKTGISFKFSLKRKATNTKAMGVEVFH